MRRRLTGWPAHLAPHLVFLIPEPLMAAGPLVAGAVPDASGRRRFRMPDFFDGGQALIEGVDDLGRHHGRDERRPPSGEIRTMSRATAGRPVRRPEAPIKIPLLRGVFVLYHTPAIGTRMLMRSAPRSPRRARTSSSARGTIAQTMVFSRGFAIGLFFALPLFLSTFAEDVADSRPGGRRGRGPHPARDLHRPTSSLIGLTSDSVVSSRTTARSTRPSAPTRPIDR